MDRMEGRSVTLSSYISRKSRITDAARAIKGESCTTCHRGETFPNIHASKWQFSAIISNYTKAAHHPTILLFPPPDLGGLPRRQNFKIVCRQRQILARSSLSKNGDFFLGLFFRLTSFSSSSIRRNGTASPNIGS